jgi:hypothetical protein
MPRFTQFAQANSPYRTVLWRFTTLATSRSPCGVISRRKMVTPYEEPLNLMWIKPCGLQGAAAIAKRAGRTGRPVEPARFVTSMTRR